MKTIFKLLFSTALLAGLLHAQSAQTVTSLSAAVATCPSSLTVASATGITTSTMLRVEDELFGVRAISGTTITVTCGQSSTKPAPHGAGVAVYVGTPGSYTQTGGYYTAGSAQARMFGGLLFQQITPQTVATATAVTLTVGQMLGGLILQDPTGGAVTTTTPTATLLVAAVPGVTIGSTFRLAVRNTADANETITVAGGTGVTISGTATIGQNNQKEFLCRFTGVIPGSQAVTCYSLGTSVF